MCREHLSPRREQGKISVMNAIIERHQKQIAALCELYGVQRLDVFGSAASGRFDDSQSDFDFIVQFEDPTKPGVARRFLELAEDLESVLGHPVDLLTDRPFRNPYFARSVEESRANVYEQGIEEIPV